MSKLTGDWSKVQNMFQKFPRSVERGTEKGLRSVALIYEGKIKETIRSGKRLKALHPFTIKMKGTKKPLIEKGDLLNAITHVVKDFQAFVGVLRTTEKEANLMKIHEFGLSIKVTPKMRKFLHAKGLHLRASTTQITIPPRPVFRMVFEKMKTTVDVIKIVSKSIFREVTT